MSEVILRAATAADVEAIIRIALDARTSADIPNLHTHDENLWFFGNQIATKPVMVAEKNGVPVGFAVIHDGWLEHLWIASAHQRRGIGRKLLTWARDAVPGDLRLYVFTHNTRAIAFYRAHGAVQIAESDGRENEERLPDLVLLVAKA